MMSKSANNIYNTKNKTNYKLLFIIIFAEICLQQAEAKQVMLLPLTAPKVYQILQQNKNLAAVPEGRVITQGIAAIGGFTLGLKKAVGAALLYDIITANITEADAGASTQPVYQTQEVCFSSRNARSLDEAEAIAEAYSRLEERNKKNQASVRKSQEKRRVSPKRKTKRKFKNKRRNKRPMRIKVLKKYPYMAPSLVTTNPSTSSSVASQPATSTATTAAGTQTTQPVATNAASGDVVTNVDAGTGLDVTSSTTTTTDNDKNPVTCVVIQKPKL